MKNFTVAGRSAAAGLIAAVSLTLWGCPNPNAIGVQQYGIVKVTCVQASNGQPVASALVQVAGVTRETDATGVATLTQVPIGQHPIVANAPGLQGSGTVNVTEGNTFTLTVSMSPT